MARPQRLTRWLVFAPAAALALFTGGANADNNQGLRAVYYTIDEIPPSKSDSRYPVCGTEIEDNINRSFDGEPFAPCPDDGFMVHYTGFLTIPAHETVQFWLAADDGGTMKIGLDEWGDWTDKGCSAYESEMLTLPSNTPIPLDGWFYENGGSTCYMLAWNIDNTGWEMVPPSAFSVAPVQTTTTTEVATTTTQVATTTTELATTTTVVLPTTSLRPSTSTAAPTTTEISTTTTVYQPTVSSSVAIVSTTSEPIMATTSSSIFLTTTTVAGTTTTNVTTTTSTLPPVEQITQQEAVAAATNAAVVAELTSEQAVVVFDAIDIEQLDTAAAAAIVAAVQDAPTEVREAFEQEIDVFSGATDNYIPLGSTVNVATRRVLVVSCAFLVAMPPVPVATRRQ
jgi:hypothetical protein